MRTLLRYPGSKQRIAPWIIQNMPKHHSYLEPYFGGGAILFNKEPFKIETVNDLDDDVINLFRTIREKKDELIEAIVMTPYARVAYNDAFLDNQEELSDVESAKNLLIRPGMGQGFRVCENADGRKMCMEVK